MTRIFLSLILLFHFSSAHAECNREVESVLDEALQIAKPLVSEGDRIISDSGKDLRTGKYYLLPDVLINYADAGCWTKAEKIYAESSGKLSNQLRSDLVYSLINNNYPKKAQDLINTMGPREIGDDWLLRLAVLYVKSGDIADAEKLLAQAEENITGLKFTGAPTSRFVSLLVKEGLLDSAEKYATASYTGWSHNALLEVAGGYMDQNQIEKGNKFLSNLVNSCSYDMQRCEYIYFRAARIYTQAGQHTAAIKVAEKSRDINTKTQIIIGISKSIKEDSVAVIEVEKARRLVDKCKGTDCTYLPLRIAEGYAAAGHTQKGLNYLNKYYADDSSKHSIGLEKMTKELAKKGKTNEIRELVNKFLTKGPSRDNALKDLAVAEIKQNNFNEALAITEMIPNSYVQSNIAITLAKSTIDIEQIKKWLDKTRPAERYIETHARSTQILLAAAARNGQLHEAVSYVNTLEDPLLKARGLIGIAQGLLGKQPGEQWAESLELN